MIRNLLLLFFSAGTLVSRAAVGDVVLSPAPVSGEISGKTCIISNDLIKITIDTKGQINSCIYYKNGDGDVNNSQELIAGSSANAKRAYFSLSNSSGEITPGNTAHVYVKTNTADQVEIQYTMGRSNNMEWTIGYIVRRGVSGIYNYAIMNAKGDCNFEEARMGFRGSADIFNYAYINDDLRAPLPDPSRLVEQYAVTDATYELADGSIYTKYDYAAFQKDDYFHGMMGNNVGLWMITPTVEWINGGPMRQDLTVHGTNTTPIALRHFHGNHLGGVTVSFKSGDQKVYGPHLMYINGSSETNVADARAAMIADAKAQTEAEKAAYPYSWLRDDAATMFGKQRGTVSGQITMSAEDAAYFGTTKYQVILAQPGKKPMLQGEGYQFWAETDANGNFIINKVRPGAYSLWVYALNGSATGYYEKEGVTVTANQDTALGTLTWAPEKYGHILWQIGDADHLSSGFNLSGNKREYGLWKSVPSDLTYTIGTSNPATDWWYAQGNPNTSNNNKTVWTIKYNLAMLPAQPLRLTLATAGAANLKLTVKSNTKEFDKIKFVHDGCVTRSATLAGRDSLFIFDIPVNGLMKGENTLTLTGWGASAGGIMYDCIKLESEEPLTFYNTVHRTALPAVSYGSNYQLQGEGIKMTLSAENWTRENYQTSWGDFSSEDFPQVAGCGINPLSADDQRCNTANNKLPAKGAYSIFEPEYDGTLKVYGRFNYDTYFVNADWTSEQKQSFSGSPWTSVEFQVSKGQKYYLWSDNFAARFCGFDFTPVESSPTGISALSTQPTSPVVDVYDLTGRKVLSLTSSSAALTQLKPGIYIVNGKKFINR